MAEDARLIALAGKDSIYLADGRITDVEVPSYRDDRNFLERAKGVIDAILSRQTVEVDTVSGATYSSRGIIAAVADALGIEYETAQNAVRGSRML